MIRRSGLFSIHYHCLYFLNHNHHDNEVELESLLICRYFFLPLHIFISKRCNPEISCSPWSKTPIGKKTLVLRELFQDIIFAWMNNVMNVCFFQISSSDFSILFFFLECKYHYEWSAGYSAFKIPSTHQLLHITLK